MVTMWRIMGYAYLTGSLFYALSGSLVGAALCLMLFFIVDLKADVEENNQVLAPIKKAAKNFKGNNESNQG